MHEGIESMATCLTNDRAHEIATDIIRISTSQCLGMKHTCCKYIYRYFADLRFGVCHDILADEYKMIDTMDSDEVVGIQEEDQYLALRLKSLVAEFTAKYNEPKVPFHDFFFGYWRQRMDEVEAEKDEACINDLGNVKEIGVMLHGERELPTRGRGVV
ncbi:hypothetical protein INS49_005681 [Diaporthe citri]|uniref:uncharacterized protein n=1 Tax=Diaporthe citri TaxID=83186 RepID=UPI001C81FFB2|nr:uncharacterized protein INS49_005681 [Diaporthe citri]KAG6353499.1 hypothetical protein INS49_005681 [Diaporthe citri]